jgi:hypothetical protein
MAMATNRPTPRDKWIAILLLLALGIVMTLSNPWFTFMDDEITMIQDATNPIGQTIQAFVSGTGEHRHPPLYDVLLAAWMGLTGARVPLLRVPATVFYLLGLWFVIQAAGVMGGATAARATLWIGVVFPYGFHFGRIAGWYSLSFCTLAMLTYAYLLVKEKRSRKRWLFLVLACELAVYTNYFLFALIGLLLVDYWYTYRRERSAHLAAAVGTLLVVIAADYPLLHAFFFRVAADRGILRPAYSLAATVLFGGYNVYTLFVSESIAPWFWYFSIPALAAIALCAFFVLRYGSAQPRRMFLGFLACVLVMSLLNLINTKRLLFLSPWLLISLAMMVGSLARPALRRCAVLALALIGAIGWFGILSRHYYAAPRLIEPWRPVAAQAAEEVEKGALVIGSNPSFFFYLTDEMQSAGNGSAHRFVGLYPEVRRHPQLFTSNQWLEEGRPSAPTTLLVKGATDESFWKSEQATQALLDQSCHLEGIERKMHDSGYALKQRWFAGAQQPAWRIEVRTYQCAGGNIMAAGLRN